MSQFYGELYYRRVRVYVIYPSLRLIRWKKERINNDTTKVWVREGELGKKEKKTIVKLIFTTSINDEFFSIRRINEKRKGGDHTDVLIKNFENDDRFLLL